MKHIYVNFKRFDIPKEYGGVNNIASPLEWGEYIITYIQNALQQYDKEEVEFTFYMPEAHLINAITALDKNSNLKIGSQGVYREDTSLEGNFGAFTTNKTANSMKAIGCESVIIGHCEERNDKAGVMREAGLVDPEAISRILNLEVKAAINAGLSVLFCIGERAEEQSNWKEALRKQLEIGLKDVDKNKVTIAYEPVWAIGPGKTPPDKEYIAQIARYIKELTDGCNVVYGGGLKEENAKMLASIDEVDGGLIALTRFQGDIGFYPEEYLEIVKKYMGKL